MKCCLLIAKSGPAAFLSHLEWSKAIERALRRSDLAITMTQGFNRHFRISFNGALAVGEESAGEFVEVSFAQDYPQDEISEKLAPQLPRGMQLGGIAPVDGLIYKLIGNIQLIGIKACVVIDYQQEMPWLGGRASDFLHDKKLIIEIERKSGAKNLPLSDYLHNFNLVSAEHGLIHLEMQIIFGSSGSIKPKEIASAFLRYAGIDTSVNSVHIHRQWNKIKVGEAFINPFGE